MPPPVSAALLAAALGAADNYHCPNSPAHIHASCRIAAHTTQPPTTTPDSCQHLHTEILARVNAKDGWTDPHNKGTYKLLNQTDNLLSLQRQTGDKKYVDKIDISLVSGANGGGCSLYGCSESQVTSIYDASTNYCNIFNLYCGSKDGCKHVVYDLSLTESSVSPSWGAGSSMSACLT